MTFSYTLPFKSLHEFPPFKLVLAGNPKTKIKTFFRLINLNQNLNVFLLIEIKFKIKIHTSYAEIWTIHKSNRLTPLFEIIEILV